jgi:hypothetical protein
MLKFILITDGKAEIFLEGLSNLEDTVSPVVGSCANTY